MHCQHQKALNGSARYHRAGGNRKQLSQSMLEITVHGPWSPVMACVHLRIAETHRQEGGVNGTSATHTGVMYNMVFITTMLTLHVPSNSSPVQAFLARHSDSSFFNHVRNSLVAWVIYFPSSTSSNVLGVEVEVQLSGLYLLTLVPRHRPRIFELLINAIGIRMWWQRCVKGPQFRSVSASVWLMQLGLGHSGSSHRSQWARPGHYTEGDLDVDNSR